MSPGDGRTPQDEPRSGPVDGEPRNEGLAERLASLSPERRRLLEQRLARERERESSAAAPATGTASPGTASPATEAPDAAPERARRPLDFSLFFFSAGSAASGEAASEEAASAASAAGPYRLLLEAARFADREGLTAVWTPERHFVDFGGVYPNPSVLGAALATATERLEIRAGSVVLPLHHPVRVAEEWAVVDNLSGGRAAISCASGWHPSDFCLAAGDDRRRIYDQRKDEMFERLETVRRLWRGEALEVEGGDGETYTVQVRPRPVRRELPVWVTSAGNTATWERAGAVGANVLAAMGSQPPADLARKVRLYRQARRRAGHDPEAGRVSLMLHTWLGPDPETVKAKVREPLSGYLRSYMRQRDNFLSLPDNVTEADLEALVPVAFEHYVANASLLNTPDGALAMLRRLSALGIDEAACLVDFGLPAEEVLEGLAPLAELARRYRREWEAVAAAEGEPSTGGSGAVDPAGAHRGLTP